MRALSQGLVLAFGLAGGAPSWGQDDALRVELFTVEERAVERHLQLTGTIQASDTVQLAFRQAGRVTSVLVREGDRIKRGQELARLDSVQQAQGMQVAEAGLAAARAALNRARLAGDRAGALLDRGVGTRAARDAAVQALSEAEGAVQRAESEVDQAHRAVSDTILRSPMDAVVTSRAIGPGQIVGAGQPVLTIAALDGLEAVFAVSDMPRLDEGIGSPVRLDTIDIRRPTMQGRVAEISPLVDPASGTVDVRVAIPDLLSDTALLGAAVRGQASLPAEAGLVVPWTALMRLGDGPAVWRVADDNRVSLVPVTVDRFGDGVIYLSDGLAPGDVVVGAGSQFLYAGRRVQQAEEAE